MTDTAEQIPLIVEQRISAIVEQQVAIRVQAAMERLEEQLQGDEIIEGAAGLQVAANGTITSTVLTDSRGQATGDLLLFNGAKFVRFSHGEPGQQLTVRSDGTVAWTPAPSVSVDSWGAVGDGVTDDTAAFEAASKAVVAQGGGIVDASAKTYVNDNFVWEDKVSVRGRGYNATTIKAKAGSSNPVVRMAAGVVRGEWRGLKFEPAGNEEQSCFFLEAQPDPKTGEGGVWNSQFVDIRVGNFAGAGFWWRGGEKQGALPHQNVRFSNVRVSRPNTSAAATTGRAFKAEGQCAKFQFDSDCYLQGASNLGEGKAVGTNVELTRRFNLQGTLTAEAAAGSKILQLTSAAGLEVGKVLSVGEGRFNQLNEVEAIAGLEVTLKEPLARAYPIGTRAYALGGTVAKPATAAPTIFLFDGVTFQNADLEVLCDGASFIEFRDCDAEQQAGVVWARAGAYMINWKGNVSVASEGVAQGTGTLTVGSKVITKASLAWKNGDTINGRGIPAGTTVTAGEGTETIEISNAVEAKIGGEGAISGIPLVKGGKGEGYVAKFDPGCHGKVAYRPSGAVDNGLIGAGEHAVRIDHLSRASTLLTPTSTGITLAIATAETLKVGGVREVVLTDAAHAVKFISGLHATGEQLVITATTAATHIEPGGNIRPPGNETLTLAAGQSATFKRTDYGPVAWRCISVAPNPTTEGTEPTWVEVEELNANLEVLSAEYDPHVQAAAFKGFLYMRGTVNAKLELATGTALFKLPAGVRPESRRGPVGMPNSEGYKYLTIEAGTGIVKAQSTIKLNNHLSFAVAPQPLKP